VVPLRIGGRVAGYLQTGHVRVRPADERGFLRLWRWLGRHGVSVPERELRQAYFSSAQVGAGEYRALVSLLEYGAEAVAARAEALLKAAEESLSPPVRRACAFVRDNAHEPLSLALVARAAGLSRHHFCTVFRRETGTTLTEHVTRVRLTMAADRLRVPGARVSEVALAVVFQSLSQFNRSFRSGFGVSPTDWRRGGEKRVAGTGKVPQAG
jgi:AraC-like DNA-binding protein